MRVLLDSEEFKWPEGHFADDSAELLEFDTLFESEEIADLETECSESDYCWRVFNRIKI